MTGENVIEQVDVNNDFVVTGSDRVRDGFPKLVEHNDKITIFYDRDFSAYDINNPDSIRSHIAFKRYDFTTGWDIDPTFILEQKSKSVSSRTFYFE